MVPNCSMILFVDLMEMSGQNNVFIIARYQHDIFLLSQDVNFHHIS